MKALITETADIGTFLDLSVDTAGIAKVTGFVGPDSAKISFEDFYNT